MLSKHTKEIFRCFQRQVGHAQRIFKNTKSVIKNLQTSFIQMAYTWKLLQTRFLSVLAIQTGSQSEGNIHIH